MISRISDNIFVLKKDSIAFQVSEQSVSYVEKNEIEYEKYIGRFRKLDKWREYELPLELTIVLSDACNLKCIYCYSDSGKKKQENCNLDAIKQIIRTVTNNRLIISNGRPQAMLPKVKIRFTGGGEPTCSWNELVEIVDHIHNMYSSMRQSIMIVLQTNGQLSDEQIDYVCNKFDEVIVSCDGIMRIQDEQRPRLDGTSSWEFVSHLLDRLRDARIYCYVRATVTSHNKDYLEEFCQYIFNNYSYIRHISISPVENAGRAIEKEDLSISKAEYARIASELKRKFLDRIRCSLFDSMYSHTSFCDAYNGKHLIVVSSGNLVKCFLEAANPDIDVDYINYYYLKGTFVKNEQVSSCVIPEGCPDCVAYYVCYGGCPRLYPRNKAGFLSEAGKEWCESQKRVFIEGIVSGINSKNAIKINRNKYGIEKILFLRG